MNKLSEPTINKQDKYKRFSFSKEDIEISNLYPNTSLNLPNYNKYPKSNIKIIGKFNLKYKLYFIKYLNKIKIFLINKFYL